MQHEGRVDQENGAAGRIIPGLTGRPLEVWLEPLDLLVVDDNPGDVRMVAEGLKEVLPAARLSVAQDGAEAINFLRRTGCFCTAPRPDLILLDLRLPKRNGFDVLRELKQDPFLSKIPVVVQTSSECPADVDRAYSLHANSYITKPGRSDEFGRTIRALVEFWIRIARIPDGKKEWRIT